ncbi:hypothetical protein VFPPC_16023 [Pochonia chlamydosporia 170]|uniref:Uncharacterized protein n=1 Tax=Pochonia chlamydosporia 170 TaxID=1380566 RepID=A0A179FM50_METCM|nr:hypothetical protein VFPPC_16023 [Pochonia chlamydosporia 170]OAQ66408.1 hypothetical protein VFPPC_16023 [Pochonia chlamydosporia 170]
MFQSGEVDGLHREEIHARLYSFRVGVTRQNALSWHCTSQLDCEEGELTVGADVIREIRLLSSTRRVPSLSPHNGIT